MKKIYFWQGLIGDASYFAAYSEIINKLVNGEYQSADLDLKRLAGHRVYSARINRSDRLLFTTVTLEGKNYLLLLEVILNHDYQKSRFLNSKVLNQYLDHSLPSLLQTSIGEESFSSSLIDELPLDEESASNPLIQPLSYYNQMYIELNTQQAKVVTTSLPAVVSGPPGSGKSCVALSLLTQLAEQLEGTNESLLYLTKSKYLKNFIEKMWQDLPLAQTLKPDAIRFCTYEELLLELDPASPTKKIVDERHFQEWFKGYSTNYLRLSKTINDKRNNNNLPVDEVFLQQSSIIYQELRILTAYEKAAYIQLGNKQSLISDKSQRSWMWDMAEKYRFELEKNESINPGCYSWQSNKRYGCISVDEAQDFSLLELKMIYSLAHHKRICYFMDTHQSLEDALSKRAQLLYFLNTFEQNHVESIQLQTAYRCPANVVTLANAVIKIKAFLSGGIADKDEFLTINPLEKAANSGEVYWVDGSKTEYLSMLAQAALSTEFAIVTLSEFKQEASRLFPTPLIFTPEEIKGLEYSTIVAYRLFEQEIFYTANQSLPPNSRFDELDAPTHRPKGTRRDDRFVPHFNKVFTSFSRAKQQLVIFQHISYPLKKLINLLQEASFPSLQETFIIAEKSNASDWSKEAQRQESLGNREQAKNIFAEKLNFLPPTSPAINTESQSKMSRNINAKLPSNKTLSKGCQYIQDFLKNVSVKNLSALLNNKNAASLLLNDFMNNSSCLLISLLLYPQSLKLLAKETNKLAQIIKPENFNRTYGNETLFSHWVAIEQDHAILKSLFDLQKTSLVNLLNSTDFFMLSPGQTSIFYYLTTSLNGCMILQDLFNLRPMFLENFSTKALTILAISGAVNYYYESSSINKERAERYINFSAFYWLSQSEIGVELLLFLLQNEDLAKVISSEEGWLQLAIQLNGNEKFSMLVELSCREIGMKILLLILKNNKNLANTITAENLQRHCEHKDKEIKLKLTSLFLLSGNPLGREFLLELLLLNPGLAEKISTSELLYFLPESIDKNICALFWFSLDNIGRKIFSLLLDKNPNLSKAISAADLRRCLSNAKGEDRNTSILFYLCKGGEDAQQILLQLLTTNPVLIDTLLADDFSWKIFLDEQRTVPISLLLSLGLSSTGQNILLLLIKKNVKILESLLIQFGLFENKGASGRVFYTLLVLCCSTAEGQSLLVEMMQHDLTWVKKISIVGLTKTLKITEKTLKITEKKIIPLDWLLTNERCHSIFEQLIKINPSIAKVITAKHLQKKLLNNNQRTIIEELLETTAGQAILQLLFQENPTLKEDFPMLIEIDKSLSQANNYESDYPIKLFNTSGKDVKNESTNMPSDNALVNR